MGKGSAMATVASMAEAELRRASREDVAEHIIATAGLAFALAAGGGKEKDLRKTRELLKQAIVKALATEFGLAALSERWRAYDIADGVRRTLTNGGNGGAINACKLIASTIKGAT